MTWDVIMLPFILFFALNLLGDVDEAKLRHSNEQPMFLQRSRVHGLHEPQLPLLRALLRLKSRPELQKASTCTVIVITVFQF